MCCCQAVFLDGRRVLLLNDPDTHLMSQESLREQAIDERALQRAHLHTRRDVNRDDADSQEKSTNKKRKRFVAKKGGDAIYLQKRNAELFLLMEGESWINKQGNVLQAPS